MFKEDLPGEGHISDFGISLLRIFLGGYLFIKGMYFMFHMHQLYDLTANNLAYAQFIISHYVVFAHVIGGFCLMIGLLTRWAALANIPVLVGAIVFVHASEGLFTQYQGLELTIIVLSILVVITITGSTKFSADYFIEKEAARKEKLNVHHPHKSDAKHV